ncbi:hypothetical protein BUALT_Bualt11G0135900 [Buddleja alternifolia]|uniref:Non-specific lipid-transfer protein n=1 Tax=Buddleja alternifolia TaxID=168488 RepID=A0AAV6X1B9_9LAMI|nr:hypothetical protein BUALT_Bualt11G0135900 [Buddleja alternifolia]
MGKHNINVVNVGWVVVVLCMVVEVAEGGITCQTVVSSLRPCMTYLKEGGDLPADCCGGVQSLNSAASTPADRQTACNCLKLAAKASAVQPQYAADLPSRCQVNIGYEISYNTDCAKVH